MSFDVVNDVHWGNLDDMRAYGTNGIFAATTVHFGDLHPSGYFGPQATGGTKNASQEQVLFSLWDYGSQADDDKAWWPALPLSESCKRNCNDCSDPTLTTGTQCKIFAPAISHGSVRLRLRQVETNVSAEYMNTTWVGDAWEVSLLEKTTGASWIVGKQLLAGLNGTGATRLAFFDEHIGCTPCDAFDVDEGRSGPWVLANGSNASSLQIAAVSTFIL